MKEQTLRELVKGGFVDSAVVVGQRGGYGVAIQRGSSKSFLATSKGEARLFTLETAARFLRQMGITRFEVDASSYEPGRIRKARPDRAEALRKTRTTPRQAILV
jgi:hypothetical protein